MKKKHLLPLLIVVTLLGMAATTFCCRSSRNRSHNPSITVILMDSAANFKPVFGHGDDEVELPFIVDRNCLIILNNLVYEDDLRLISPKRIEYLTILKPHSAIEKYGAKGEYGVMEIETRFLKDRKDSIEFETLQSKWLFKADGTPQPRTIVEKMPSFNKGGVHKFKVWLTGKTVKEFPSVQGRLTVSFVSNRKGLPIDIIIIRTPDGCDGLTIGKIISESPRWKPGKHKGINVDVKHSFSIYF